MRIIGRWLLASLFERPRARLTFTKAELRRLITDPVWTVVTAVVSGILGLALYAVYLNEQQVVNTLTGSDPLAVADVVALVPMAPLTPVVVFLAVGIGLGTLVAIRVDRRMEERFGPDFNR